MKTKDLISYLFQFDPDTEIFVAYDDYIYQEPDFKYYREFKIRQSGDVHQNCLVHIAD